MAAMSVVSRSDRRGKLSYNVDEKWGMSWAQVSNVLDKLVDNRVAQLRALF